VRPQPAKQAGLRREFHAAVRAERARAVAAPGPETGAQLDPPTDLDHLWEQVETLARSASRLEAVDPEQAVVGYAPLALLDGVWLGRAFTVRESNTELGAALLEALNFELGDGDTGRHHGNAYRAALASRQIVFDAVDSASFAQDSRFAAADLELALVALNQSRLASALGYQLANCWLELPGPVRATLGESAWFVQVHDPGSTSGQHALSLCRRCLEAYADTPRVDWSCVWRGAKAAVTARERWLAAQRATTGAPIELERQVLEIFVHKAPHALGYHGNVTLGGEALDRALASATRDSSRLLGQVAASRYVVPGEPAKSALLRSAEFGGRMFGVFSAEELALIGRWIETLASPSSPKIAALQPATGSPAANPTVPATAANPVRPRAAGSLREAYHALLTGNDDVAPSIVQRFLSSGAAGGGLLRDAGATYSAEGLWAFVDRRHHAQVFDRSAFAKSAVARLRRDDVKWLLTQLAPSSFVDGCWLSALVTPERAGEEDAALLFRIYRDELGAGHVARHHGNVFRQALESADVQLAACSAREFVDDSAIVDGAFALPTYWLAIARQSRERWPELLGLNLAIELAGLGETYELATALLRRHGIDPYFFELHNSIDNPASGHTAFATRAIQVHLERLLTRADTQQVSAHWRRILNGFASYERASAPLQREVLWHLVPRLAWRWAARA